MSEENKPSPDSSEHVLLRRGGGDRSVDNMHLELTLLEARDCVTGYDPWPALAMLIEE